MRVAARRRRAARLLRGGGTGGGGHLCSDSACDAAVIRLAFPFSQLPRTLGPAAQAAAAVIAAPPLPVPLPVAMHLPRRRHISSLLPPPPSAAFHLASSPSSASVALMLQLVPPLRCPRPLLLSPHHRSLHSCRIYQRLKATPRRTSGRSVNRGHCARSCSKVCQKSRQRQMDGRSGIIDCGRKRISRRSRMRAHAKGVYPCGLRPWTDI